MTRRDINDRLEAARKWAATRHTRISSFGVFRAAPTGTYVEAEFPTLAEARAVARERAKIKGREKLAICAITPEGWVFRLEDVSTQ
jgi:hypothetical protein